MYNVNEVIFTSLIFQLYQTPFRRHVFDVIKQAQQHQSRRQSQLSVIGEFKRVKARLKYYARRHTIRFLLFKIMRSWC